MKAGARVWTLLITVAFFVQSHAQPPRDEKAQGAAPGMRVFRSNLGFDLSYPAAWTYNDLGPPLPVSKMDLDKQAQSDAYRRSVECTQNIFSARLGEPRSTFLAGAIATDCMGGKPDLDSFTNRTAAAVEVRYRLSGIQYGAYAVQGQNFWVMRATGSIRNDPADTQTIEYVATVLPAGLVYWQVQSRSKQAEADFEHAHLHLANGVETELIPTGAFGDAKSPAQDFTSLGSESSTGTPIMEDRKASHHFESGLGFSYEVPQDLMILDTQQWEAAHRARSATQSATSEAAPSHRCGETLLVATVGDQSKLITVRTGAPECIGPANSAESLHLLMATAVVGLSQSYTLRNPQYGSFSAGAHQISVIRSTGALKKRPWEADKYIAMVFIPARSGVVEYFLGGRTRADLDALMATRLRFDDGTETALIPAGAFAAREEQAQSPASSSAEPTFSAQTGQNSGASHHFNSGLGFSFEVPEGLTVLNARQYIEAAKGIASQQSLAPGEQASIQCAQGLLIAGRNDLSRMIAVTAHARECVGYPLSADSLTVVGESGIGELTKRYEFVNTESARFAAGAHQLWAMRARITPKDTADPHRYLAVLVILTTQGVAECILEANSRADLDSLMAIRLGFDDGAETELIPDSAFGSK
jgi:hypothetical protein